MANAVKIQIPRFGQRKILYNKLFIHWKLIHDCINTAGSVYSGDSVFNPLTPRRSKLAALHVSSARKT